MHSSIITKYRRHRGTPTVLTNIHKPRVRIESVAKFSKLNTNMATIDNAGHAKYCCTPFFNGDGRLHKELSFHKVPYRPDIRKASVYAFRRDPGPNFFHLRLSSIFFANTDTPATCILVALDGNIYHANVLHL